MAPRLPFSLRPALAACLCCVACAGPAAAPGAAATPAASSADSATPEALARRWLDLSPGLARAVGLHEYDGRVGDYSAAGIERQIATYRELAAEIERARAQGGTRDDALDLAMLGQVIALALFDLTEAEAWRTRPAYYSELFSIDEYIVRDYAPVEQRAQAMHAHLTQARSQVAHIERNLRSPLSEPVTRTSIDIFKGFGVYLRGDVQRFLDGVADATLRAETRALAQALAAEAERLAARLERVELPRADQSHVLGRERYEHLLRAQEALTTPIEQLERLALDDLARNKAAYEALSARVQKSRPPASELLDEARRVVDGARTFIVDRGVVSLPSEPHVEVRETPPYMRWNSAFLNAGGPFDAANLAAYYYVTLPDPAWPPAEQAEYVMSHGEIVSTSVHEVFPGHYLQSLWQRKAPTFVQKVVGSYSFVEGWAHYTEQMMVDEGFAADLPEARLGQLSDALLRNCRFVASIGIHVRGMSVAEAQRLFRDDCKQDEAGARQQAVRGTFDPGYFAYTLGKLQILELRREVEQRLGPRFELRRFHDALLSHGAPPVPLLRERVLADLGAP
ncbi:MAG TPA: DUF885 domain-containing protein [Polyangiaceae bacterium]|nr:DUF885 domain-containing protein [Polyangiaceae bacterium]